MSHISPQHPRQNRILAALPLEEYERLEDDLELVTLSLGQILYQAGNNPEFVYFPTTCIVSLIFSTEDGSTAELAMTGNDGFLGVPLVLGGASTTHEMVVQSAGEAYRLRAEKMARELDRSRPLQRLCLCYAQALMTQMSQSVVCNRHHTVEQQLCRWLLVCFDQLPVNQLKMTQELIANMLGVRREAVTEAAVKLQASGLIQYRRGQIMIANRPGLEARVCECYRVVKSEYNRLFTQLAAPNGQDRIKHRHADDQRPPVEPGSLLTDRKKPGPALETDKTLEELKAHQLELVKQNEQLQQAYVEADALRNRYADIYDFAPVGHFTLDPKGGIIDINLAGAILLGIKRSENRRHRFSAHLKTRCVPAFNKFVEEVLLTNKKKTCETVLAKTAQRPETVVRIEAVPDESGQECRIVVIDMSTEKTAEKPIQRNPYDRTLLDNFPFMAWLKDEEGRFLAVNASFASNFGASSIEAVVGKTMNELAADGTSAPDWLDDSQALLAGKTQDFVTPFESRGKRLWFETSQSPIILDGKRSATVGFAREITGPHDAYLELAASEKRCRGLVDNLPLCVAITQHGILKYVNAKAADLIGYAADECIGQPLVQLIHEADRTNVSEGFLKFSQNEIKTGASEYAVRLVTKKSQVIECLLNASAVEWEGEPAVMGVFEDVTQRKQLEAELRSLATTDSLTDLANRRYFLARQNEALSRQKRGIDHKIAVLMLDLDHFKDINDAFGHLGGDEVLRNFSSVLRNELRQIDLAGRMGGEEFAVMLPETDMLAAAVFAERLRQKVASTSVILDHQRVSITVSIGIALMSAHDIRPDQVLQRADEALYRAKTLGRNRIELADAPESPVNMVTPDLADDKFSKWSEHSDPYALGNVYQTRRFRFDNRQNRPS